MNIPIECSQCDEEARVGTIYDFEFNPHDITESGQVKLHLVQHEMFVDSSYGRCRNGHRDPPHFLVGAIADALADMEWDGWEREEAHQAASYALKETGAGSPSSGSCALEGGEPVQLPAPVVEKS